MSIPKKKMDVSVLKRVFTFAAPYKKKFYLSIFLAVFLAIIAPVRPLLIQLTINNGIKNSSIGHFINGPGGFIVEITIIQIVLLLIETTCRFFFTFTTASLGQSVVKDLRITTYNKIVHLNLSQFDKTPIGTLTTRTINDIESVNDIFSDGLIPIIADMLSIISILTYMFIADWSLTLICLTPFPFLIIATYYFKESVNKSFIKVRNAVAALNAFVQEHITGMGIVQAFAAEKREQEKFNDINNEHRNANVRSIFAYSVFFPVVELVSALSVGLLVWWAGMQAGISTEKAAQAGGIITSFILCLNLLFRPLRVIADKFNVLQMGVIASERVFKILDNEDVSDRSGKYIPANIKGDLTFDHVWFSYIENRYVLKDINFTIKAGETLAIVGHTGSGKTSIISLINRLYQIQKGSIKIDDINIEEYDLDYLRSKIGIVLQDVFLFSETVEKNIAFGLDDAPDFAVKQAAQLANIDSEIESFSEGYKTMIGERGVTLSGGQKQRISIARALIKSPSVVIFDDCLSAVDARTEKTVLNNLNLYLKNKTAIIITHRIFSLLDFDKIIVLDEGSIVEQGQHHTLIKENGYYAEMYNRQQHKEQPI